MGDNAQSYLLTCEPLVGNTFDLFVFFFLIFHFNDIAMFVNN